jgi:hypothetical protein
VDGDALGVGAHVTALERTGQAVSHGGVHEPSVAQPVPEPGVREQERREVHALHPAGDHDLGVARPDLGRGEHDRLEPRAAHPVDRRRRGRIGQPARKRSLAGRCLSGPGLQHLAHQDLVDRRSLGQAGALDGGPDRDTAEVRRRRVRQGAAELADRRAGGADEEDLAVPAGDVTGRGRARRGIEGGHQRVRGNPRSIFDVPGSGQRWVTIFARV